MKKIKYEELNSWQIVYLLIEDQSQIKFVDISKLEKNHIEFLIYKKPQLSKYFTNNN